MSLKTFMLRTAAALSLAVPIMAAAQDATVGATLYNGAIVSGKQSCSNAGCHGMLPGGPTNRISNAISAGTIKATVVSQSQMAFLQGKLTDAQFNDLAAYVAATLGGSPSYLTVAAAPKPSLTPTSLSFPSQTLGTTSSVQTVTVTNAASATAPLVLGTIATTAGSDFAVAGGGCKAAMSLAAGASCTVALSFTPTVSGTRSGTLTVAHNGPGGASVVSLSGLGGSTAPTLSLSPSQLAFSQTVNSASDAQRVVVANTGGADLVFSTIALSGTNAAEFAITGASTCSASAVVPGGSNCVIEVRFTPAAEGARTASLTLQHNAGSGTSTVALVGQGNAGATPGLALDATLVDLGTQAVGLQGPARTLTVSNNGQANLLFTAIGVSGVNAAEIVRGGTCSVGMAVAPALSCTVTLALKPAAQGTRSASLDLVSNAPVGTASVTLTGEAVPTPAPYVSLSQAALGFGRVSLGKASVARSVVLGNSGSAALAIASIQSSSPEFAVTHDCPASLAAGASCTLNVVYMPTAANAAESVVITSNAFSSPNSVVLTGVGASGSLPVLSWSGGTLTQSFPSAEVGKSADGAALTLMNNGPGAATVSAFGLAGANPDSFSVGGGTCTGGTVLAVGASCTVVVRFVPDAAGARNASLLVASNGSNPPDIALSGTGSAGTTPTPAPSPSPSPSPSPTPAPPPGSSNSGAASGLKVDRVTVDFRSLIVNAGGRSEPLSVRITNAASATGGFIVQASATAEGCLGVPWTLGPGASCTVDVVFAPQTGGAASGTLRIEAADSSTLEVPLNAEAQSQMTNVGGGAASWPALWALLAGVLLLARSRAQLLHGGRRSAAAPGFPKNLDLP
jgi:hypothetical protein